MCAEEFTIYRKFKVFTRKFTGGLWLHGLYSRKMLLLYLFNTFY